MQLYRMGSLAKFISSAQYRYVSLATRIDLAAQVARGMKFMHEKPVPILHLDLKCSNLLLDESGDTVVIADFGLATQDLRAVDAAVTDPDMMHTTDRSSTVSTDRGSAHRSPAGNALTFAISPPEVLSHPSRPRSPPVDVFAFGMVLYEIVCGQAAWRGYKVLHIREAILSHKTPQIPTYVPNEVATLITSCWAAEPSARPTFRQLAQSLSALL